MKAWQKFFQEALRLIGTFLSRKRSGKGEKGGIERESEKQIDWERGRKMDRIERL